MKYAVIKCVNGVFSVESEWEEDKNKSIVDFHRVCTALWNADDVEHATVEVVDEKFYVYKIEFVKYES